MSSLRMFRLLFLSVVLFPLCLWAQWIQTNGPYERNILCFATGVNQSGVTNLYTGTGGQDPGVFLSTNMGANWTKLKDAAYLFTPTALAVMGDKLFAGANGVFLSTDNGISWTATNNGLPEFCTINCFAVSGTNLFAGTNIRGIYLSTDYGQNWNPVNTGLFTNDIQCLSVNGKDIYTGAYYQEGVFRSTNNGESWSNISSGLPQSTIYSIAFFNSNLFAGTQNGVFISANNGTSWEQAGLASSTVKILCVNGNNLFAGTDSDGIFISADGKNWTAVNSGLPETNIKALTTISNGTVVPNLYAGTSREGVFISTNKGASWSKTNNGFPPNTFVTAIVLHDNKIITGTDLGAFRSGDKGLTWDKIDKGYPAYQGVKSLILSGQNLVAGSFYRGIYLSTDYGENWKSTSMTSNEVYSLALGENNIWAGTDYGVYISADNGSSWTQVNNGLPDRSKAVSIGVNGTNVFASIQGKGIFLSNDNGKSWTEVNNGLKDSNIASIAIKDGIIFAGGSTKSIFFSTDNGNSWKEINTGIINDDIWSLYSDGSNLFAGTLNGHVFLSSDNGETWAETSTGISSLGIISFAVDGNHVFAGTYGNGLWKRPLSDILTGVQEISDTKAPEYFSLKQNYPNPFNPSTTISYSLPIKSYVQIRIFDILGREVSALVSKEQSLGEYQVQFDGSSLPSGVYVYTIRAGQYRDSKKLVLLK